MVIWSSHVHRQRPTGNHGRREVEELVNDADWQLKHGRWRCLFSRSRWFVTQREEPRDASMWYHTRPPRPLPHGYKDHRNHGSFLGKDQFLGALSRPHQPAQHKSGTATGLSVAALVVLHHWIVRVKLPQLDLEGAEPIWSLMVHQYSWFLSLH